MVTLVYRKSGLSQLWLIATLGPNLLWFNRMTGWRKFSMGLSCHFARPAGLRRNLLRAGALLLLLLAIGGCDVERRRSNAELGLDAQQVAGRKVYDDYCDRCHEPYSSRGKKGPGLKGLYKRPFLPMSGMPANDDRLTDIVRLGREKMPGFGPVLTPQQIKDLLSYLHTL
jgi:mono/diheme cytochrome c family protein